MAIEEYEELDIMSNAGKSYLAETEKDPAPEVKQDEGPQESYEADDLKKSVGAASYYREVNEFQQRTEMLNLLARTNIPFRTVDEFVNAADRLHRYATGGLDQPADAGQAPAQTPADVTEPAQEQPGTPPEYLTLKDLNIG